MERQNIKSHKSSLKRGLHPYVRALSRDALLAEVDERMFDDGETEEVEHIMHGAAPAHGLSISWT